jgi:PEGA domain
MKLPLVLVLTLAPAAMAVASIAHADPPAVFIVSEKQASDRADELVNRALALGNKDRYAEAEPLLREAWELKHSYDIAANLGIVQANLGKWREAAEHLAFALKTFPTNGKPEHRKLGELTLASVLTHVGALTIKVNVDRAEVFVDGRSLGVSPLSDVVFLDPGERTIEARRSGHATVTRTVNAQAGTATETTLELREAVPAGPPPWKPGPALIIPAGVLAVGGLAAGIGLTVAANGKGADRAALLGKIGATGCAQSASANAPDCATLLSEAKSQSTLANGAVGAFVAGGALALVTGSLVAWAGIKRPPPRDGLRLQVAPALGATERGVVVRGTW